MLALLLLCTSPQLPPPAEVVDQGAIAWLQVPRAGATLSALHRSRHAGILRSMLLPKVAEVLRRPTAGELLVAMHPGPRPGRTELTLLLDLVGESRGLTAVVERWLRQRGYEGVDGRAGGWGSVRAMRRGDAQMQIVAGAGRWGIGTGSEPPPSSPASRPLSATPAYRELLQWTTRDDLRARVDLQRLFGTWAGAPRGAETAGFVRRLGLERASFVELGARLEEGSQVRVDLRIGLPRPWRGLPAAFGPPVAPAQSRALRGIGRSHAVVSVLPAALWSVFESAVTFKRPLETAMALAQLDAIERHLRHSWTEDALGHQPQLWRTWATASGRVLVAPVLDVELAREMLVGFLDGLPLLFPAVSLEKEELGVRATVRLVYHGRVQLVFAFGKRAVVLASDADSAAAGLRVADAPSAAASPTGLVAVGNGTSLATLIDRIRPRRSPASALAGAEAAWSLRHHGAGFALEARVGGE